jgi:hypothetical protein
MYIRGPHTQAIDELREMRGEDKRADRHHDVLVSVIDTLLMASELNAVTIDVCDVHSIVEAARMIADEAYPPSKENA